MMNLKLTISFLPPVVFMLLLVACGGGVSESDIEATVEARVELAKASLVAPTAAPLPTYTPYPVPTPEAVVKEMPVEVIKEVIVERIVQVVVTATPTSEPTPVTTDTVYEWEEISAEYEVNALVANSKYLNQTISIRGTVSKIDYRYFPNSLGFGEDLPAVTLEATSWYWLHCGLDSLDKVRNLSVGDAVIVTGTVIGWKGKQLYLYPCS